MKKILYPLALALSVNAFADNHEEAPEPEEMTLPDFSAMVQMLPEDDIGLLGRFHFATGTTDFDAAREFYRKLGYGTSQGGFPLTNTHQMAQALGMDVCQYELVKGEVLMLDDSLNSSAAIDLLQWKIPFDDAPPYELPNHIGMAYAAFLTTDLAADMAYLKSEGVEFLSDEPYGIPGDRFAFFRDPEGILYKLMETAPPHGDPEEDMHIVAMPHLGINVSDFDTSLAYYKRLGYTNVKPLPETGTLEEARAYGLDQPFKIKGADISLGRGDNNVIRLVQWIEPFNPEPAYPPPINRIGIDRIALPVAHLDRAVKILKDEGLEFLSEVAPCCSGTGEDEFGIVHLIDPDGVFLELIGTIDKRKSEPQPAHCPPLEIKMPAS
ncbi:VOC family protein [Luminiphilus syltensis]|nr:VOC family protein [Luminiphilus syltensis]